MIRHLSKIIWILTEIEVCRSICVRAQLHRIVDIVNDNMIMVLGACADVMMCKVHDAFWCRLLIIDDIVCDVDWVSWEWCESSWADSDSCAEPQLWIWLVTCSMSDLDFWWHATFADDVNNDHSHLNYLLSSFTNIDGFAEPHSDVDGFFGPFSLMNVTCFVAS